MVRPKMEPEARTSPSLEKATDASSEYGTYKTVKTTFWLHERQLQPYSGTYKTVKTRLWHIQDSQDQILADIR